MKCRRCLWFLLPPRGVLDQAVPPLTSGLVKALLFVYSSCVNTLFMALKCSDVEEKDGSTRKYLTSTGGSCGSWQYLMYVLAVPVMLSPLLPLVFVQASRLPALQQATVHIQHREEASGGLKENFWWWAFALALFRGVLAILPALVPDEASLAQTLFVLVLLMLVGFHFLMPYRLPDRWDMAVQEGTALALLATIAGSSIGGAVLQQGALRSNSKLHFFDTYKLVLSAVGVAVAGASLLVAFGKQGHALCSRCRKVTH